MGPIHVIAVDDDRHALAAVATACRGSGCAVHPLPDAGLLESALRTVRPVLVFLDLNMRHTDGVELLRLLAAERRDLAVVLTSDVDPRLLDSAYAIGCSLGLRMLRPLCKPLSATDVRQRLRGCL